MTMNANALMLGMAIGKSQNLSPQDSIKLGLFGGMMGGGDLTKTVMTTFLMSKSKTMFRPRDLDADKQDQVVEDNGDKGDKTPAQVNAAAIEQMAAGIKELSATQHEIMAMITKPVAVADQQSGTGPAKESKPKT